MTGAAADKLFIPAARAADSIKRFFPIDSDISSTSTFKDIWRRQKDFLQPSHGNPVDFGNVSLSPDGRHVAGVATVCQELKMTPSTRLAIVNIDSGHMSMFGERQGSDSHPKWSPDGGTISFLSKVGSQNQLHLLDVASGNVIAADMLQGSVDQASWSQDGRSILLLLAGMEADVAGIEGGHALRKNSDVSTEMSWMPVIDAGVACDAYRTAWIYDVASGSLKQATPDLLNIWEAVWTSRNTITGLCSDSPGETNWYHASLREISLDTGVSKTVFTSDVSMAWLAGSPNGERVAFAVGIASDRGIFMGTLHIQEVYTGRVTLIDTHGMEVNAISWAGDHDIAASGLFNGKDTIIHHNLITQRTRQLWSSEHCSVSSEVVSEISAVKTSEVKISFVMTGWFDPPTLVIVTETMLREIKTITSTDLEARLKKLGQAQSLSWNAPDGQEILGYLLSPPTLGPHPTVMHIHGGPVWGWRPRYLGKEVLLQALLDAGFAIFEPNPRGFWGRGQEFTRQVYGDMGGADTYDLLSGLDTLISAGKVDPRRLGVFGNSYGGFMTAWLVSQTDRFGAAVATCPATDWISAQFTSNLSQFCQDFIGDNIHDPTGKYFTRSPIHHVRKVKTPTLIACGGLDKNTPASQGQEFHQGLLEQGNTSVFLVYPKEGHGIRQIPASLDLSARIVDWFRAFLV